MPALGFSMGAMSGQGNAPPWMTGPVNTTTTGSAGVFGPQPDSSSGGSGWSDYASALNPFRAFGLTITSGIIAVGLLILLRQSLAP